MADVINRITKEYKKSVNTPDYSESEWIINPDFIPDCKLKYMVIDDNTIREMTIEEKTIVDYVEPIPEPKPLTLEEIDKIRNTNIAVEIAIKYPLPLEMALHWKIHTGELTMDSNEIIEFRQVVTDAKLKYPKP